jgi:lipopolysaccharide biosynthesis regulator YciM
VKNVTNKVNILMRKVEDRLCRCYHKLTRHKNGVNFEINDLDQNRENWLILMEKENIKIYQKN